MPAPQAEVVEDDGPPKTEVEQLQWKIDTTTDEVGGSLLASLVLINLLLDFFLYPFVTFFPLSFFSLFAFF